MTKFVTWSQFNDSQPVDIITGSEIIPTKDGYVTTNSLLSYIEENISLPTNTTLPFTTVGVTGSGADYEGGGSAIESAVNASLTGSTIEILPGIYTFASADSFNFGGKSITLKGAGKGKTIFRASGSMASFAFIYDFVTSSSSPQYRNNIRIEGITFDVNNDANFKAIEMGSCQNITIIDCAVKNVADTCAIQLGLIGGTLGAETNTQIENSASRNIRIINVDIEDSDFGTREGILLVNCQNSYITGGHYTNITGGPAILCPFGYCRDIKIFNNSTYNSDILFAYVQESDNVYFVNNTHHLRQEASALGSATINVRNSQDIYIYDNTSYGYTDGSLGSSGFTVFDFNDGTFDSHASRYIDSKRIFIRRNRIIAAYTAIKIPSQIDAGKGFNQSEIFIEDNYISGGEYVGVSVGVDSSALNISGVYIRNNSINGGDYFDTGGIEIIGDSSDNTALSNVVIEANKVTPSSRSNATGIWLENVNNIIVKDNDISGAGKGTYAASGIHRSGTVTNVSGSNNLGVNPEKINAQGNITGATTFTRVNGSTITATATGNVTTTITNGVIAGDALTLIITQDATGGRTISKPANVRLVGGAFNPTAAANAVDSWTLVWDGTNWREVSRSLNMS